MRRRRHPVQPGHVVRASEASEAVRSVVPFKRGRCKHNGRTSDTAEQKLTTLISAEKMLELNPCKT